MAVPVVKDLRLAAVARMRGRDASRQNVVVDLDQLGRVLGLMVGLGDHERDMIADVAHLALGQVGCGPAFMSEPSLDLTIQPQISPPHLAAAEVGALEHREHAGRRLGPALVDAADPGVRMRRADEVGG